MFTAFFLLEVLIKWVGLGWKAYFTNVWSCFDFTIAMISVVTSSTALLEIDGVQVGTQKLNYIFSNY